jgi:hypothetical protein
MSYRIDPTRSPASKARTLNRRNARRLKSGLAFLALAFPPQGETFGNPQGAR